MDNRQFNVNGRGKEMLLATLKLAFEQDNAKTADAFVTDSEKGMIILAYAGEKGSKFPVPLGPEEVTPIIWKWLESKPKVKLDGWDINHDHDGHNGNGWRVYCEDWGHVGSHHGVIVAVKPVYLWYGK